MSESASAGTDRPEVTIYTAYEIDFMLGLRDTENARITREQIGLRSAPEQAREFVTAAVTSGLRARGKVERSADGQWLLGEEGQVIAGALTSADRWLGIALVAAGVVSALVTLGTAGGFVSQGVLGVLAGVLILLSAADRVGLVEMLRDRTR